MTALVEVDDIHVSYGQLRVLQGVSLAIEPGESVALLGTNGAGKSTLLKATCGVLPVAAGSVRIDGEDVTGADPRRILAEGIVQVPGGRATFGDLTVAETLRVGCWPFRKDRSRVAERIAIVHETFPVLERRMNQAAGTLSGGEQQMLALSRALLHDPRLLMIDELSLGLAPVVTAGLIDIVRRIQAQGVALLVVDQRLATAIAITDRACFLERGVVRFSGPTSELVDRGDLVRSVFLAEVES